MMHIIIIIKIIIINISIIRIIIIHIIIVIIIIKIFLPWKSGLKLSNLIQAYISIRFPSVIRTKSPLVLSWEINGFFKVITFLGLLILNLDIISNKNSNWLFNTFIIPFFKLIIKTVWLSKSFPIFISTISSS